MKPIYPVRPNGYPAKILGQISTHCAIENSIDNTIEIWQKGFEYDGIISKPEYCWSILKEDEDDLFAIWENLEENNRCNVAEFINN